MPTDLDAVSRRKREAQADGQTHDTVSLRYYLPRLACAGVCSLWAVVRDWASNSNSELLPVSVPNDGNNWALVRQSKAAGRPRQTSLSLMRRLEPYYLSMLVQLHVVTFPFRVQVKLRFISGATGGTGAGATIGAERMGAAAGRARSNLTV